MKKIICSKILLFVFFLLAIFPLLSFKVIAEEKKATSIEKKKVEIIIDPKWVRMDTAVEEISAGKMKVTRTFADRDPMGITIYFDSETKVVKGEEELKVSDIKQGDKVEVYYQKKWLGDFMKRLGRVIKIKGGKENGKGDKVKKIGY